MAETENNSIVFRCPDCGKAFRMKKPAKGGRYRIPCPNCGKEISVNIPEPEPESQAAPDVCKQPTAAPTDNSAKEMITMPGDFLIGTKYEILCPHCNSVKMGYVPQEEGVKGFPCPKCHGKIAVKAHDVEPLDGDYISERQYTVTCPHCDKTFEHTAGPEGRDIFHCPECGGRIVLKVRKPTQVINLSVSINPVKGKLQLLRKWGFNKNFPLPVGHHTIGRYDEDEQSDIAIKDDPSMSRRSVQIDVDQSERGYSFKLKVLKSTNPVLHNNQPLNNGDVISLNFGDSIILGKTQLRFVKDV